MSAEAEKHTTPMPKPRDPDIAVREEYDAAAKKGTIAAWQLFIARHPKSHLAAKAKQKLDAIK